MSESVFIVESARSAIGSPFKSLRHFSAGQVAAAVIEGVLRRAKIRKTLVDEVILGNTVGAGTGQNMARQATVLAGLLDTVPAYVVNNVCGAGMQAIFSAAQAVLSGQAGIVVAGGAESATQAPLLYPNELEDLEKIKLNNKRLKFSQVEDGLLCRLTGRRMGELAEDLAQKYSISREQQDQYALESHVKACVARQWKKSVREIIPIAVSSARTFEQDERPRKNLSITGLSALPAAFCRNGSVTAGNASVPSDGAAAVVVAAAGAVKQYKLKPVARILSYTSQFGKPQDVFASAIPAIERGLKLAKMRPEDADLFEISEAFAAQAIYVRSKLKISAEKLNIWGGDIALGHPLGAAGARVVVTLLHALRDGGKQKGVACVSLGGGGSLAIVLELLL